MSAICKGKTYEKLINGAFDRELEKQRQQEWEQARIAEMNAQKQREQERVLKQKAHNTQLNVELSTLNERVSSYSHHIPPELTQFSLAD